MTEEKVNELLQRYFDGATTLEEERDLQRYFAGDDIADSLAAYRPMFTFFANSKIQEINDSTIQEFKDSTIQRFKNSTIQRFKNLGISESWNFGIITAIAASIAILLWIGLAETKPDNYVYFVNGKRVYDENAAIASAEDKLQLLASSMQTARNSMSAFDKLQESNQSLQQLSKISNTYRQIEEKLRIRNEE